MRRWSVYLMVAFLMVFCAGLIGCNSEEPQETSSPPADEDSSNELGKIMDSAREVSDLSFEIVSTCTSNDQTVTTHGKYWISDNRMRMESETAENKAIYIINGKGETWVYNPTDKTALKMPDFEVPNDLPNEWSEKEDLDAYKIVGHEKMDGYDCVVVTITGVEGVSSKMWLMEDNGMPVRMEAESPESSIVTQYKNYSIGKSADDLFELPDDAQVIDMSVVPDMSQVPEMP